MRATRLLLVGILSLLVLTLAVPPQAQEVARYQVVDLGTLGGEQSHANAINDRGHVVGWAETGEQTAEGVAIQRAFLWSSEDGIRDLGTLGGASSAAHDLSNRGDVVGSADGANSRYAFRWSRDQGMLSLVEQTGYFSEFPSEALAINERGEIAGYRVVPGPMKRAVVWKDDDTRFVPRVHDSRANDINEAGEAVGDGDPPFTALIAFRWSRGRVSYPMRRDRRTGGCWSEARGINNRGEVVGRACAGAIHWRRGRVTRLPMPAGDRLSTAMRLNEQGQVVGWSKNLPTMRRA